MKGFFGEFISQLCIQFNEAWNFNHSLNIKAIGEQNNLKADVANDGFARSTLMDRMLEKR